MIYRKGIGSRWYFSPPVIAIFFITTGLLCVPEWRSSVFTFASPSRRLSGFPLLDHCSEQTCSWVVDDPRAPKSVAARHPESSNIPRDHSVFDLEAAPEITDCLSTCPSGRSNANCIVSTPARTVIAPVTTLFTRVTAQVSQSISQPELIKLFALKTDPCRRGPTVISATSLVNNGNECLIAASLDSVNLHVIIQIPERLTGSWKSRTTPIVLSFENATQPVVRIFKGKLGSAEQESLHPLNGEFGGKVNWLQSDGHRLFLKTKGCLGVSLD